MKPRMSILGAMSPKTKGTLAGRLTGMTEGRSNRLDDTTESIKKYMKL